MDWQSDSNPPTLFMGIKSISDRSDLAEWTVISKPHCTAIPTPHVQAKMAPAHLHAATFYNRALTWTSADPRNVKLNIHGQCHWEIKVVGSFVFFEHPKDYISTYTVAPPCGSPVGGPSHLQHCKKTLIEPDQHTQNNNRGNIIAFTSYSFPCGT